MIFNAEFTVSIAGIVCYGLFFTSVEGIGAGGAATGMLYGNPLPKEALKEFGELPQRRFPRTKEIVRKAACHETHPNKLNIHLIPHTHDDVGWLKTVDQYYYGSNKAHAPFGVQYILDSVVSELEKHSDRRFVYVETAYFWRWWEELDKNGRESVKKLVTEGRLEFLLGGWCMSDEATPHYSSMIDQMTLGLKFLNDTFGEYGRPNVAWQIDPFGHSSEVAIEFAEMGYEGVFLGRIDYEDHLTRKNTRTMETIWRPDPSLGEAGDLFTSVLFDLYTPPPGFCFDIICSDDPIMDNPKLHGFNVKKKIAQFQSEMKKYQQAYKTNHILVTMGQDFTYSAASPWFRNIDKLIKYANQMTDLNLVYSTPSCYLKALNALNTTWKVKESDDFFPYGSDEHSYWTGYFTSRPALKYYVYLSNNILQATKQIAVVIGDEKFLEEEFLFKRSVAIAQHHDGVSGTERQHVTDDYALYLDEGLNAGIKIFNAFYKFYYGPDYPDHVFGNQRNISKLQVSQSDQNFVITIYNPIAHEVTVPVKFPVLKNRDYRIFDQKGKLIQHDCIPVPKNLMLLPGRNGGGTHDVFFIAKSLPQTGVTNYYVQAITSESSTLRELTQDDESFTILDNGKIQLTFKNDDGLLYSIKKNKVEYPFRQNFYTYDPVKGFNKSPENRASGAYIFRPTEASPSVIFKRANITKYTGINVYEIRQTFSKWLSQIIRLYKNSDNIEFEWLIGPLPIGDFNGIELVTKYTTDIASNSTFYTDSNGRRWVQRVRNYRKSWLTNITEPVASNYYPLTTAIKIEDAEKVLTVIVDRPEGGTSMQDGEIEIMLHRRLLYDDGKGVAEPLDEHAFGDGLVVRGKHVIQLHETANEAAFAHRLKTLETVYQPVVTFANTAFNLDEWLVNFNRSFSVLNNALPLNVHILTLERWREGQILLRLEHIFQANESSRYSHSATVNVKLLVKSLGLVVTRFEELTLAANVEKKKLKRLKWNAEVKTTKNKINEPDQTFGFIMLQPMEIKTYLLYVRPRDK